MESLQCMLYLCSPLLRTLHELEERQMHIADIAPHDVTRDLILLNQQRLAEMELSNQLERKKEELRILSKHLEEEKKKTEALLYAMLPKHVANQLKEGKRVEAGEYDTVIAKCKPIIYVTFGGYVPCSWPGREKDLVTGSTDYMAPGLSACCLCLPTHSKQSTGDLTT